MNKLILLIIVIAISAVLGIVIASYVLHIPAAENLTDGVESSISDLTGGSIDGQALITTGSIATTGVSILGAYSQFKQKGEALVSSAKSKLEASDALGQVTELKNSLESTKTNLETQLQEATTIKDQALEQAKNTQTELESVKQQLERQVTQTETAAMLNSNTIQNLWKNSGSEFWTDPVTKEKFKLLKLETEIIK